MRARLGLRDTWAYFNTVSSSQAKPSSPRATRWGGPRTTLAEAWPLLLAGAFEPAPSGRTLAIERRGAKRWRKVAETLTSRGGRFRLRVARPGIYRVRAGTVTGAAVRLR